MRGGARVGPAVLLCALLLAAVACTDASNPDDGAVLDAVLTESPTTSESPTGSASPTPSPTETQTPRSQATETAADPNELTADDGDVEVDTGGTGSDGSAGGDEGGSDAQAGQGDADEPQPDEGGSDPQPDQDPAPREPSEPGDESPSPDPKPRRSPPSSPSPTPEPTPAAERLEPGRHDTGITWIADRESGSWIESSSTSFDRDGGARLRSDLASDEDRQANERDGRCATFLEAGPERRLVADGTVRVRLVIERSSDGGETDAVATERAYRVDVELDPGERFELAPTDTVTASLATDDRVYCEVFFAPAE